MMQYVILYGFLSYGIILIVLVLWGVLGMTWRPGREKYDQPLDLMLCLPDEDLKGGRHWKLKGPKDDSRWAHTELCVAYALANRLELLDMIARPQGSISLSQSSWHDEAALNELC